MQKGSKFGTRQDFLLAALASAPKGAMTPVQVQKTMFLLAQKAKGQLPSPFYRFEKYNYGPFCQPLYDDLALLAGRGEVVIDQPPDSRVRVYRVTKEGAVRARTVSSQWSDSLRGYIQRVTEWVTSLSFPALLRAIYEAYPAYKENSIFRDR